MSSRPSCAVLRRIALAAALAAAVLRPSSATAHGFEGDRFFPPTVQTEDPFATDELSTTVSSFKNPGGDDGPATREIDVSTEFDKEIFPKFALGVEETYINLKQDGGPSSSGFDNLSLSAKYQLWENAPHEFILSLGGEVDLGGTGSKTVGAESFTTFTPTLYFGKGLGDLPTPLNILRPLAITGTLGQAIPTEAADPNSLEWGLALEYSLPYLQQHVKDIGLVGPFRDMIPLVEFSMSTPENRAGGPTTGTISPGVLWESKYVQLGAEALIPLNSATGHDVGAVFSVQIYIDDILPKIFGHPLLGGGSEDK